MNIIKVFVLFTSLLLIWACERDTQWEGQAIAAKVKTQTVPIVLQHKGIFDLGKGVFVSNDFAGARLNGTAFTNDTISVLIMPENEPINTSPWYSFKIWSESERQVMLKFTYPKSAFHRYYPKLSHDGLDWEILDSAKYQLTMESNANGRNVPTSALLRLAINSDTLWLSAQELKNSVHNYLWESEISKNSFVENIEIGKSTNGKSINALRISETDDKKMIVVFSRQHPPEVTGYIAMQEFVETICDDTSLAANFRSKYSTYVIPLINPDGVDNGHWRHNQGGADLNRDWNDFNQPETSAVRDFLSQRLQSSDGKYYFSIDFHSTWQDIFYVTNSNTESNMPGFVPTWIDAVGKEFEEYEPNIRPVPDTIGIGLSPYMFYQYGAESLTYEVGDNSSREIVKRKGEVAAIKLMELMMK